MRHMGKFVGFIRDTLDPDSRGRIRCYCPEIMGEIDDPSHWLDWALPCFPWIAQQGVGDAFVPQADNQWGLWLEFRHGDARFPIWCGVFPMTEIDSTVVVLQADEVRIGDPAGLTALANGVVVGGGIDPFTGQTYAALQNASAKVLAEK